MSKLNKQKLKEYLRKPQKVIVKLFVAFPNLFKFVPDDLYLKIIFRIIFDYSLNLKNPKTFNEKIQWLKLYDRNPLYTQLVDKYEVRKFVAEKIGEEHLIPLLGVWDSIDEIDFDKLPSQFVLKCTHDSGSVVICKDKKSFDIKSAKKKLRKGLKRNFWRIFREWPYKNIKPRIIAEKYMSDLDGVLLKDYKFFCFDSEPKFLYIVSGREIDARIDFFDLNFNRIPVRHCYNNSDEKTIFEKPENFQKMLDMVKILAKNSESHFVRIDIYENDGRILFGEYTFYPMGGFSSYAPKKYEYEFGDLIKLPMEKQHEK